MRGALIVVTVTVTVTMFSPSALWAQTWNGGYIAGHVGFGTQSDDRDETIRFDKDLNGTFGDTITTLAGANAFSPGFCGAAAATALPASGCAEDEDGVDVGVRAGYDWQRGRFVAGGLASFNRQDATDSVSAFSTTPAFYTFTRELEWVLAFGGRAGVATDRVLVYGVATAAWAHLDNSFTTSNAVNTFVESDDDGSWGYQAGAGVEFRLQDRIRVGGEYLFTRLADEERYTVRAQGPAPATNPFILTSASGTDFRRSEPFELHAIRATIGIRF